MTNRGDGRSEGSGDDPEARRGGPACRTCSPWWPASWVRSRRTGELATIDVQVQIVDKTNDKVLLDETRATFDNGFIGFWLPRDIEGNLRVTYDGKTGEAGFATSQDAPTCLTTLQLV